MRNKLLLFVFFLSGLIWSCKGGATANLPDMPTGLQPRDVIGRWTAESMVVQMNGKSSQETEVKVAELAAKNGKKPALTVLEPNGTYREVTLTLQDSVEKQVPGRWHIYGDSLYMRLDADGGASTAYHATRSGNSLLLRGKVDFDGDGARDDQWKIKLKKLK